MQGVHACHMLPVDGKKDYQHHYEEQQYKSDPRLLDRDHLGSSLSRWKAIIERSSIAHLLVHYTLVTRTSIRGDLRMEQTFHPLHPRITELRMVACLPSH